MKAVLDIGKTHIKLLYLENNEEKASFSCKNAPIAGMYPQADTEGIWQWLLETLKSCSLTTQVNAIVVTTHGATAALINENCSDDEDTLALPVLDYEFSGIDECRDTYHDIRPAFHQTYSPLLPAGLNLGKQLYWLQHSYPSAFAKVTAVLLYPQYWAWKLCGVKATEVTSLGCHTDLWDPAGKTFSPLVESCGWESLFPPMRSARDKLDVITPEVAQLTHLPETCCVYTGIHDSNASLLRYLNKDDKRSFTVISTGTWTILMQINGELDLLNDHKDMLANVDVNGNPVACARFMGGREYERICTALGGNISMAVKAEDIQHAITNGWMVTPDFSEGNGPYGGMQPQQHCSDNVSAPQAIATLYCALMIDKRLNDLHSLDAIYIEGAFLKNPLLCQLVAQLRSGQSVYLSDDNTGTVLGAASLIEQRENECEANRNVCLPSSFHGIETYRQRWLEFIHQDDAFAKVVD